MAAATKKKGNPVSSDRKRVNALMKAIAETPEGGQLLDIARNNKIRIVISDRPREMKAVGLFSADDKEVSLLRSAKDEMLAGVLAHELRHMWQSKRVNLDTNGLSALDAMVHRRVVECDAFAYQIRFEIAMRDDELKALRDALKAIPDRKQAAAATKEFNKIVKASGGMKNYFDSMQVDMKAYDDQTLEGLRLRLKLAQLYAQQKKHLDKVPSKAQRWEKKRSENRKELTALFNQVAHPRKLDNRLVTITKEGLGSDSKNYLRYRNVENLAAQVRKQIPKNTVKKAEELERKIIATVRKTGVIP